MFQTTYSLNGLTGSFHKFICIDTVSNATSCTKRQSHMGASFLGHFCIALSAEAVASLTDDETSMGRLQEAVGIKPELCSGR
jgi:hypothetical protein